MSRGPDFDADTALEPAGEHLWRGAVPPTWSIGTGPNGGFLAALAARAAELASGTPPRSITIHYLAPPAEAVIDVEAVPVRQGRTTAFLRLQFTQEGTPVALALAVCGAWRDDAPSWADGAPPPIPPPAECGTFDRGPETPPLMSNYEMRFAPVVPKTKPARLDGWLRTAAPRRCDHALLAAMTDAMMPPAFFRARRPISVPTLELTMHFRARLPEGEHPWVQGAFVSRYSSGGVCEEDGELWSEDGTLLVQSRQLALVKAR